jgi:hypothetical protein
MRNWGRQATGWLAAVAVIGAFAIALSVRGGSISAGRAPTAASPSADAVVAEASRRPLPSRRPTPEPTIQATSTPQPATPTPVPATPIPTAVTVAPAPAATATPVPVHDDEPTLMTHERVDGRLGQTLTIDGYSVRAVRVAAPADDECATILQGGEHFYQITLTYSGPLFNVDFDIGGGISMWCIDADGSARDQYPSGVTRAIVAAPGETSTTNGLPFSVFITTVNGPHSLWFVFN